MDVCIVGAGVIGTIYGAVLSESGHTVSHLVRPGGGQRLVDGVEMNLLDARRAECQERHAAYRPPVIADLHGRCFDLVLASVRHTQVEDLLPVLAAGDSDVVLFGNWWSAFGPVDEYLAGRYSWAFPVAGGGFDGNRLDAALLGRVIVSGDPRHAAGVGDRAAELFASCGLEAERPPDMLAWLWVHFATEAGIVAAAMKAGNVTEFLDDTDALSEAVLAVREALSIVAARGVDPWQLADAQMFLAPERAVAQAIHDQYQVDHAARRIMERHTGGGELAAIYREVTGTGHRLSVATPILDALGPYVDAYAATTH
jgi:2-dehydropantoate 2-reductase